MLALAGGIFLGFPGGGYIYLDNLKRGLIYGIIGLFIGGISISLYLSSLAIAGVVGIIACSPSILLPLVYISIVTYDTYLYANGNKTILPEFDF